MPLMAGAPPYVQELQSVIRTLQYTSDAQAQELQEAKERANNLEDIIAELRKDMGLSEKRNQEIGQTASAGLKLKIRELESEIHRLGNELSQAKESTAVLALLRKSVEELQKQNAIRDKNIEHLHSAVNALTEAFQGGEVEKKSASYRVKAGDTLEKIANAHKTSVKKIKELNNLASDRIILGQELKIPEV